MAPVAVTDSVAAGRTALESGRWGDARAAFAAALETEESADALAGLGEALWWLGDPRASIDCHERAYAALRRAHDASRAAWTAMWLSLSYGADLGNRAAARGWLARAERVLRDVGPGPLRGWLWLIHAGHESDRGRARLFAERALDFARGSGDLDLELCALGALGATLVELGQVADGFALIDEAMAGALGGERRQFLTVVFTSCSMLSACERASDLDRAAHWCRVVDGFIGRYGCPYLFAYCRAAYGSILVATGRWADAERELLAVLRATLDTYPALHGPALARLADLRLRQGRLEEAEELLSGVDSGVTALPSAAVLLARGAPDAAASLLARRLAAVSDDSEAACALELIVEAHAARGDLDAAGLHAHRLAELAEATGGDHVRARAAHAAGRVSVARGDLDAAVRHLEQAVEGFARLELRHEAARSRLELARALAPAQPPLAAAEARRALVALERLGADADADAAGALLRALGAPGRTGPKRTGTLTRREREVLHLVGLGLSNPEIAQRLLISRKTAAHHVSSLLAKLSLRNRAAAAAYATRTLRS